VVAVAAAAGRVLISLDVGLGDIRAYPPGSHAGIVVLGLTDQLAAAVSKAVTTWLPSPMWMAWPGQYRSCSAGYCESAILERTSSPQGGHQVRKELKGGSPQTAFSRFAADARSADLAPVPADEVLSSAQNRVIGAATTRTHAE
jgi:hypothetical protein